MSTVSCTPPKISKESLEYINFNTFTYHDNSCSFGCNDVHACAYTESNEALEGFHYNYIALA